MELDLAEVVVSFVQNKLGVLSLRYLAEGIDSGVVGDEEKSVIQEKLWMLVHITSGKIKADGSEQVMDILQDFPQWSTMSARNLRCE